MERIKGHRLIAGMLNQKRFFLCILVAGVFHTFYKAPVTFVMVVMGPEMLFAALIITNRARNIVVISTNANAPIITIIFILAKIGSSRNFEEARKIIE